MGEQNEGTTNTQCKVETMMIMNIFKKVMFISVSQLIDYLRSPLMRILYKAQYALKITDLVNLLFHSYEL